MMFGWFRSRKDPVEEAKKAAVNDLQQAILSTARSVIAHQKEDRLHQMVKTSISIGSFVRAAREAYPNLPYNQTGVFHRLAELMDTDPDKGAQLQAYIRSHLINVSRDKEATVTAFYYWMDPDFAVQAMEQGGEQWRRMLPPPPKI